MTLLEPGTSAAAEQAAGVLKKLSMFVGNRTMIVEAGAVGPLIKIVADTVLYGSSVVYQVLAFPMSQS